MAQTPRGGHRDTQWVIQFRKPKAPDAAEEPLWERQAVALNGPVAKQTVEKLRQETFGLEWRVVRIESTQRVEDW